MKDMELYDSFIRETTDLLGAPTQKWAYKERDAWKDTGESELVLLRDAAYELGGGANDAVNFTCVTSDSSLVPADEVRRNIRSVAQSLLPVALYNPAGRKRRALLDETLAVFREHRGRDVLCAYVKNAGREQETKWVGKLSEFPAAEVDMSTLIIIGGPRTRLDSGVLYEPRGYVEKYME